MNLLLDTHVWVWAVEDPIRLGRKCRAILQNANSERHVCTASALEIARWVWGRDLTLQVPLKEWLDGSLQDLKADVLAVTLDIAVEAYSLPEPFHRDPADRQIVACARLHQLRLITADDRILDWGHVATFDARR